MGQTRKREARKRNLPKEEGRRSPPRKLRARESRKTRRRSTRKNPMSPAMTRAMTKLLSRHQQESDESWLLKRARKRFLTPTCRAVMTTVNRLSSNDKMSIGGCLNGGLQCSLLELGDQYCCLISFAK